jgi:hypothetical protein
MLAARHLFVCSKGRFFMVVHELARHGLAAHAPFVTHCPNIILL